MTALLSFAPLLERFFTQRLIQQRQVSPHTISSYRDTFRQFLKFTRERVHKPPSALQFEEIDAPLVVVCRTNVDSRAISRTRSRLRKSSARTTTAPGRFAVPANTRGKIW